MNFSPYKNRITFFPCNGNSSKKNTFFTDFLEFLYTLVIIYFMGAGITCVAVFVSTW